MQEKTGKVSIGHFANFCPHSNGMVSTVIDLIKAERLAGYDAQFIDWGSTPQYGQYCSREGLTYEDITTVGLSWAIEHADILYLHSNIPDKVKATGKPIIVAMHGRPEYSFELERQKRGSCLNLYHTLDKDPQVAAFVSFWEEHIPQWELILSGAKPIFYIPATVNLDKFNPDEPKYNFGPDSGTPNILLADVWREDLTPFNCLMACAKFIEDYCPQGKVHVFGLSKPNESTAYANIFNPLKRKGIVGQTHGLVTNIEEVYRAADFMVTPQVIATRTVREALASGCPVIADEGNRHAFYTGNVKDIDAFAAKIRHAWDAISGNKEGTRVLSRREATLRFSVKDASRYVPALIEHVMAHVPAKSSVEITKLENPGFKIHNFVAYRYEDMNIGQEYNEYMSIIGKDDWACFIDHDAMFTTPDWYRQLYGIIADNPQYSCFTAVTNRIGNKHQCFVSVDKNNHDILYHRGIGKKAQQAYRTSVKDMAEVPQLMSGVVILVKKSAWEQVCGFKQEGFLGVDNYFHKALNDSGLKTGLMKGVYVYHFYRADGSTGLEPAEDNK